MKEETFLDSLTDLSGRVAIVTGGGTGIGLQSTIYLASKGATVYVAARNDTETKAGLEVARQSLVNQAGFDTARAGGAIKHHYLDLASVQGAWQSAEEFKKLAPRLDIVICNAGVAMAPINELSADGYDLHFAVNNLGHFAFVTSLIGLVKKTADAYHQDGRIVFTISNGYRMATRLDYDRLRTRIVDDGKKLKDVKGAFERYVNSKLAVSYTAIELSKRIRRNGITNIYVNACHPGNALRTDLGKNFQSAVTPLMEEAIRTVGEVVMGNSTRDSAKTQVYLAASPLIIEKHLHGVFWMPQFSLIRRAYKGCEPERWTILAEDADEAQKLWECNRGVLKEVLRVAEAKAEDVLPDWVNA